MRERDRLGVALCVGVNGVGIADVNYAEADCALMSDRLSALDWEVISLRGPEATRGDLLRAIAGISAAVDDHLLVYFSGHAVRVDGVTTLVLHGAEAHDLGIEVGHLCRLLSGISARQGSDVTLILDCCRSAVPLSFLHDGGSAHQGQILDSSATSAGTISILAAAPPDDNTWEDPSVGMGVFTFCLLEGLRGLAANDRGQVTIPALYDFAATEFAKYVERAPVYVTSATEAVVIAEGLPPGHFLREGREEEVADVVAQANALINQYRFRDRLTHEEMQQFGHKRYCNLLEPTVRWFNEQELRLQKLLTNNNEYMSLRTAINGFLVELASISHGTSMREGVIEDYIGSGNFGTVFKLRQPDGTMQALKLYHATDIANASKRRRFHTGFAAMQSLDHEFVVPVVRYSECPVAFAMQYVDGENLEKSIPFQDPEDILQFFLQVCEGIMHGHTKGVIHRDIKPANILLYYNTTSLRYEPRITDFDLARIPQSGNETKVGIGTESYSAPEQFAGFHQALDARKPTVDVYSLGRLLYFLIVRSDPVAYTGDIEERNNKERLANALRSWPSAGAVQQVLALYDGATKAKISERTQDVTDLRDQALDALSKCFYNHDGRALGPVEFLRQLMFNITGHILTAQVVDNSVLFQSRTGRTEIRIEHDTFERRTRARLQNSDGSIRSFGKSGAEVRIDLNRQIDGAIVEVTRKHKCENRLKRRSGTEGSFSTFVDLAPCETTPEDALTFSVAVRRTIEIMEAYGV